MIKKEIYKEASDKFRISAARLQTYYNPIEWINLWFIPSRKEVDEATVYLIGLSNNTPPGDRDDTRHNAKFADTIRKKLKIKFYE